jgi:hypothetical protein
MSPGTLGVAVARAETPGAITLASSQADVRLNDGTAGGQISLDAATGSIGSTGLIRAQGLSASAGRDIAFNDVTVRSSLDLSADGGTIGGDRFESSAGSISLRARDGIGLTEAVTGSALSLSASGAIRLDLGRAGTDITVTTQSAEGIRAAADLGSLEAGRDIRVVAGDLPRGTFTAGRDIRLEAGSITLSSAEAGDDFRAVTSGGFTAGGVRTTGMGEDLSETGDGPDGSNVRIASVGSIAVDTIGSRGGIELTSSGSGIRLKTAEAAGSFSSRSGSTGETLGGFAADGVIASAGDIAVTAPGDVLLKAGQAGGNVRLESTAANVASASELAAGGDVTLSAARRVDAASAGAGGALSVRAGEIGIGLGTASAGDLDLSATGAVVIQDARAGDDISIVAGTTALVRTASALGGGTDGEPDGFNLSVRAAGDLSLGELAVAGNLRLVSTGAGIIRIGASDLPAPDRLIAGGSVFVSAISDLNLPNVSAGGSIELNGAGRDRCRRANGGRPPDGAGRRRVRRRRRHCPRSRACQCDLDRPRQSQDQPRSRARYTGRTAPGDSGNRRTERQRLCRHGGAADRGRQSPSHRFGRRRRHRRCARRRRPVAQGRNRRPDDGRSRPRPVARCGARCRARHRQGRR